MERMKDSARLPPSKPGRAALATRFADLVERLGARAPAPPIFDRLYSAWASSTRHYHDVEHLIDCLREVDGEEASTTRDLVELALWYHDAIYEPGKADCEARSAKWLAADCKTLGLGDEVAREATALVEATAHGRSAVESDAAALVVDIDLSILGREAQRFMEFEYGVEKEYAAIPTLAFRRGRGRFLAHLLVGPIYRTSRYRERFESAARANISALLASDRYRAYRWTRWLPGLR